jgi:hypothetical protein
VAELVLDLFQRVRDQAALEDAQYRAPQPDCCRARHDQLRLLQSVTQRAGLCAEELCQQLVDEVQQLAATKDFADDVCLIAMTIDHLMKD